MKNIVKKVIPMNDGIFSHINYEFLDFQPSELDMLFLTRCGMRSVGPSVWVMQDEPGALLTSEQLTILGSLILKMYKVKWDKISRLIDLDYDPIHNFSDITTEDIADNTLETNNVKNSREDSRTNSNTETRDLVSNVTDNSKQTEVSASNSAVTRTDDLEHNISKSGSNTTVRTDALNRAITHNETSSISENSQDNIFGFNSQDAVGDRTGTRGSSDENNFTESIADTGKQTTEVNTTDTINSTDSGTVGTVSSDSGNSTKENTGTKRSTETGNVTTITRGSLSSSGEENAKKQNDYIRQRRLARNGNIGNISTQKLVAEEIELWRWNFIEEVLNDVKDFLTIPVYD